MPSLRSKGVILEWANGRLILVQDHVITKISAYTIGNERNSEAGGILLGGYREAHIEVSDSTEPMAGDRRYRFAFDRRDPGHQARALQAWKDASSTDTFVGEWHTHPEPDPTPSWIDRRTWRRIVAKSLDPVVFVILGWNSNWYGVGHSGKIHVAIAHQNGQ